MYNPPINPPSPTIYRHLRHMREDDGHELDTQTAASYRICWTKTYYLKKSVCHNPTNLNTSRFDCHRDHSEESLFDASPCKSVFSGHCCCLNLACFLSARLMSTNENKWQMKSTKADNPQGQYKMWKTHWTSKNRADVHKSFTGCGQMSFQPNFSLKLREQWGDTLCLLSVSW